MLRDPAHLHRHPDNRVTSHRARPVIGAEIILALVLYRDRLFHGGRDIIELHERHDTFVVPCFGYCIPYRRGSRELLLVADIDEKYIDTDRMVGWGYLDRIFLVGIEVRDSKLLRNIEAAIVLITEVDGGIDKAHLHRRCCRC